MRIRLFGALEVQGVPPAGLGSRKQRTLLGLLALAMGRTVSVDRIAEVLWGEAPPARPADQVSVLVSRLRAALGPERIARTGAGYALRSDWLDVEDLMQLAAECSRRRAAGDHAAARQAGLAALALVRGPLLDGAAADAWAAAEVAHVERVVADVRRATAASALSTGDTATALELARGLLDVDPLDEEALRLAMAALAGSGRRASALDLHERHRLLVSEALGVDLSAETTALHDGLLRAPAAAIPAEARSGAVTEVEEQRLAGRRWELARLRDELSRARLQPRLTIVRGEPGIGKTTLVEAFAQEAARRGWSVLTARCPPAGGLPLQPVLDLLRGHLNRLGGAGAAHLLGADAAVLGPHLGQHLGGPGDPVPARGLLGLPDPREAGVLGGALLGALERVAAEQPLCLVIEDVHDADPATVTWLASLARSRAPVALLAVVTTREARLEGVEAAAVVALEPFDLEAVRQLVGEERAEDLLARSGGNPLFLVELAAGGDGALPPSLREAVAARCDRLGAEAAATVRTAAVLGEAVDIHLLASLLGLPTLTVLGHLEAAVPQGLLRDLDGHLVLRNTLVGDVLRDAVGAARRSLLHLEAARILAAHGPAASIEAAYHARLGGDPALAAACLAAAARTAVERADHAAAEALLDEAVRLSDTSGPRLERARIRLLRGRYAAAAEDAEVALAAGAGADALEVLGFAAYYRRDLSRALALAQEGAAGAGDAVVRAGCLLLGGRAAHALGLVKEAAELLVAAAQLAEAEGLELPGTWLGMVRVHQGRPDQALGLLRTAVHRGLPGHAFAPLHLHFVTAYALATAGRPADALAELQRLDEEMERRRLPRFSGRAGNVRGWILRNLGDPAQADECNRGAEEQARAAGGVEAQAHALLDLADGRLQAGDWQAAEPLLDAATALQEVEHAYRWRHALRGSLLRARLLLGAGDAGSAAALAERVEAEARMRRADRYIVLAGLVRAGAAPVLGRSVELEMVDGLLRRLPAVAGLERWWLLAEAGAQHGVDRWRREAEAAVAELAAQAGPMGSDLVTTAASRLERISAGGRAG